MVGSFMMATSTSTKYCCFELCSKLPLLPKSAGTLHGIHQLHRRVLPLHLAIHLRNSLRPVRRLTRRTTTTSTLFLCTGHLVLLNAAVFGFYMFEMLLSRGRTIQGSSGSYLALQDTCGSGHRGGSTAAQGGQVVGGGHVTTGQRWTGHGGHSPILQGLLQVEMHGGHGGTADFRMYFDISGGAGHSDFSM